MVSCCMSGCTATQRNSPSNHTFHRVPCNPIFREKWLKVINRRNWTARKTSTVCSKHFEQKCFIQRKCRRVLHKDAIPTLFVSIKLPKPRTATSYVYRDIFPSEETNIPPSSIAGPSNILSPRKKLINKNLRLKQKIEEKNRALRDLKGKTKRHIRLHEVVKELNNRPGLINHQTDVAVACSNNLLSKLVDRVNGKASGKNGQSAHYEEELKKFALTVHFYSPRSYAYMRDKFDLCLPHVNNLRNWYSRLDCEPGFTKESFDSIAEMSKDIPIYVGLTFNEIKIREEPEILENKHYGYVNIGNDLCGDEIEIANEILVFMVVAVNGYWKLPVGFFPSKSFTASEKARLLKICLDLLKDANCEVISVTLDGTASNLSMVQTLGASVTNPPYKPYFLYNNTKYNILFDPCHLIKLIRNCLAEHQILFDNRGCKIEYKFVEQLHSLHNNEDLQLDIKLPASHIDFRNQTMNVRPAVELLSRPVGDAIDLRDEDLHISEFENSEATVQFLHHVTDIFDIFNTINVNNNGLKKPLCPSNKVEVFEKLDRVYDYFGSLKSKDGRLLIDTPRRLGFLGFKLNILSLKWIFANYVQKDYLKFLSTYKFSQVHLETLFDAIRSREEFNNNPTVKNFIAAYKTLLCNAEIKTENESDNCLVFE